MEFSINTSLPNNYLKKLAYKHAFLISYPSSRSFLSPQFRFFVISAILASAMAFAPSVMRSSRYDILVLPCCLTISYFSHLSSHTSLVVSSALRMSFAEELPGATAPFGFFDPLGLSKVMPSLSLKNRFSQSSLIFLTSRSSSHSYGLDPIRTLLSKMFANGVKPKSSTAVLPCLLPLASSLVKKLSSVLLCSVI